MLRAVQDTCELKKGGPGAPGTPRTQAQRHREITKAHSLEDVFQRAKRDVANGDERKAALARIKACSAITDLLMGAQRGHVDKGMQIQPEHLLLELAQLQRTKLEDVDAQRLRDAAREGETAGSGFAPRTQLTLVAASLHAGERPVTLDDLVAVLEASDGLVGEVLRKASAEEARERTTRTLERALRSSTEAPQLRKLPQAIAELGDDLVEMAQKKLLDPIAGRTEEIGVIIRKLSNRDISNLVLTGDQGVGKTALVEGLATLIAEGRAPKDLRNARIVSLRLGTLAKRCNCPSGPSTEDVVKNLVAEVEKAKLADPPMQIIFFVDEIANLEQGATDLLQTMKPHLARGRLRIIGACTTEEYRQTIRKDPALANRLSAFEIKEPSPDDAVKMLLAKMKLYGDFHGVTYDAGAAQAAVDMTMGQGQREGFRRPRSAMYWMDSAGAMVKLQREGDPPRLKLLRERIRETKDALSIAVGDSPEATLLREILEKTLTSLVSAFEELEPRIEDERTLLDELEALGRDLAEETAREPRDQEKLQALTDKIAELRQELAALPERNFLEKVDAYAVYKAVAEELGIPIERVIPTPTDGHFDPEAMLKVQVFGQDEAIASVARRIKLDRAKLRDPSKPIGAHLLAGPSGVGKTELAKVTADVFYNGAIATVSCNSLQRSHELAILKGAPPGYVGFGETVDLAEIIRGLNARGGGILLFDEIEKAHPDIFPLIMQIIDEGMFVDAKGQVVDCSRIHILMTSNLGSDVFAQFAGDGEYTDPAAVQSGFNEALNRHIRPEVLGRILRLGSLDIFRPLRNSDRLRIVERELRRIGKFGGEGQANEIKATDEAIAQLAKEGFSAEFGGRALLGAIAARVQDPLAELRLSGKIPLNSGVTVTFDGEAFGFEVDPRKDTP